MTEQRVLITNDQDDINDLLKIGWYVINVTPQHTSTGGNSHLRGYFLVVLEKTKL